MSLPEASPETPTAPPLHRRLAAFVYEGVLLFGVVMITGLFYAGLTQQKNAMVGRRGLMAALFIIIGLYFVWFWSHGGQTLAMKAWKVRLVDVAGQPVREWRALWRYLLSWMWFLPACLTLYFWRQHDGWAAFGILALGVIGYALTSFLSPTRQWPHDLICGTRIIAVSPAR